MEKEREREMVLKEKEDAKRCDAWVVCDVCEVVMFHVYARSSSSLYSGGGVVEPLRLSLSFSLSSSEAFRPIPGAYCGSRALWDRLVQARVQNDIMKKHLQDAKCDMNSRVQCEGNQRACDRFVAMAKTDQTRLAVSPET